MSKKDLDAGSKKVTLYYASQLIPHSGYVTEHVQFKELIERDFDTGKVILPVVRRKHGRAYIALGLGRGSEPVLVEGWQPEYNSFDIKQEGKVTTKSPRFSTAKEWSADFDNFFQGLMVSGVRVVADYRGQELGYVPLSGMNRTTPWSLSHPKPPPVLITPEQIYSEGATSTVTLDRYERDPRVRKACLDHYGRTCQICKVDFASRYPGIGDGFIEVHHLKPLSEIGKVHQVDPVTDLLPVCPNCHSMLHRQRGTPYTPDEVRAILKLGEADASGVLPSDEEVPF